MEHQTVFKFPSSFLFEMEILLRLGIFQNESVYHDLQYFLVIVVGMKGFACAFTCRKCQKVLGKNMELWENEVYRFKTIGQLKVGLIYFKQTKTFF